MNDDLIIIGLIFLWGVFGVIISYLSLKGIDYVFGTEITKIRW